MTKKAIVIGAGIVGLATARTLAAKGYTVSVLERTPQATGASVRNFGMIWPVGQPEGFLYETAVRSRKIWEEMATRTGMWHHACGSLHLAYTDLEWTVLQELEAAFTAQQRPVRLLTPQLVQQSYPSVQPAGLKGGLFSATELIIDPRAGMATLPAYLKEQYGISFTWNTAVTEISTGKLVAGGTTHHADLIVVCSGTDFETLYPAVFQDLPITRCKLQMMRFAPPRPDWQLGTALCGGLSLTHYDSFRAAPSVDRLIRHFQAQLPLHVQYGIHVMVCQNGSGELTVGDSHEYGLTVDPFDKQQINQLILNYLKQFVRCADWQLTHSWNGVYPKLQDGRTHLFIEAAKDVYIFNGLKGAGMTLSFGLAEQLFHTF